MKKIYFVLTILFGIVLNAQVYVENDNVDEFTKARTRGTNLVDLAIPNRSVKIMMGNVDETYLFSFFTTFNLGCGGASENYITFLFDDGNTITYREDIAQINCKDINVSTYIIEPLDFVNRKVVKVRLKKTNGIKDVDWKQEQNMDDILELLGFNYIVDEVVSDTLNVIQGE